MASLPQVALEAWRQLEGLAVLATVDESSVPNAIYVTCLSRLLNILVAPKNRQL
ncbi:MAG: hypothetical protein BWZ10_03518 [candidate division BRC1 bacterium ADurb.BinA364]|nr:MAG: hypothetical protein BWZ10_03518 [candidate division BRC1 bacterium ADurb.BinA364]